jgi:UDP-N-acetylmuramoylalanine--D-glutamate ligase
VSSTLPQAVVDAFDGAATGDVVLLAPGCASFDQYQNFAERGDDFRRAARSLGESGRSDG